RSTAPVGSCASRWRRISRRRSAQRARPGESEREGPMRIAGRPHKATPRRGMSIAEVMISMAIAALLLVGVSAAYTASADAVEANDNFFRATQAGRVTMTQLLTEIRRADSVLTAPTND